MINQIESEVDKNQFWIFLIDRVRHLQSYLYHRLHWNGKIGCKNTGRWRVEKTIEKNKEYRQLCINKTKYSDSLLCLAISWNQCLQVPTHFAWSHHIIVPEISMFNKWQLLASNFIKHTVYLQEHEYDNCMKIAMHWSIWFTKIWILPSRNEYKLMAIMSKSNVKTDFITANMTEIFCDSQYFSFSQLGLTQK